jgi:uncharacterized heparinase superfamily protein
VHKRRLRLAADGQRLEGCDRLDGLGAKVRLRADLPYAIHFHLMPGASCCLEGHGQARITLKDGQNWLLSAAGAALSVEDSAYFAESGGPRAALQIVLRGVTFGETEVNWVVERLAEGPLE